MVLAIYLLTLQLKKIPSHPKSDWNPGKILSSVLLLYNVRVLEKKKKKVSFVRVNKKYSGAFISFIQKLVLDWQYRNFGRSLRDVILYWESLAML